MSAVADRGGDQYRGDTTARQDSLQPCVSPALSAVAGIGPGLPAAVTVGRWEDEPSAPHQSSWLGSVRFAWAITCSEIAQSPCLSRRRTKLLQS